MGAAWYLPEERYLVTKSQFSDQICVLLGGRVAEELVFDDISSGALDDLEKATKQAYSMVAHYGMDEKIGSVSYHDSTGAYQGILGKPYSEEMGQRIDKKVGNLINLQYEKARAILIEHRDQLEALAALLLEKEEADIEDLERIMGKRKM